MYAFCSCKYPKVYPSLTPMTDAQKSAMAAFTLTELLVVVAIMAAIASFVIPAATSLLKGADLIQGGQKLADQLTLARQSALADNHQIEVRLYQYADPNMPGEQSTNASTWKFRGMQLFEILDSGSASPIGKAELLPATVIIDKGYQGNAPPATTSTTSLSTITSSATAIPLISGTVANMVPLPRAGIFYNCVAFRFENDGSTNLPPGGAWFFTVHNINLGDGLTTAPNDFFTIQIDPTNGHVRTFRP